MSIPDGAVVPISTAPCLATDAPARDVAAPLLLSDDPDSLLSDDLRGPGHSNYV
jgi:hypothetical protein